MRKKPKRSEWLPPSARPIIPSLYSGSVLTRAQGPLRAIQIVGLVEAFRGNQARPGFQDLSSCPATVDAARCGDAFGLGPGNAVEQSDMKQAYMQAKLQCLPTWAELPENDCPASWRGTRRLVCPLVLGIATAGEGGECEEYSRASDTPPSIVAQILRACQAAVVSCCLCGQFRVVWPASFGRGMEAGLKTGGPVPPK